MTDILNKTKHSHIYLGNLKSIRTGRLIGNVLIEPFLTIPDNFVSISSKTGKKVIQIVIDRNDSGPDKFGYTHTIRLDDYVPEEVHRDTILDWKAEKECLANDKLGISEIDIENQNNSDILNEWKMALIKESTEISLKMDVKINKGKLDNATYLKMKQIKKIIGILTQQIQLKLGELKKQNKMDAHMQAQRRFREIAKEILDEKTFNQIIERLKSESVSKI
jgi:hypothetical protein